MGIDREPQLHMYPDDTAVYVSAPTFDQVASKLNKVLARLHTWCCENCLTPHPTKTEYMLLSGRGLLTGAKQAIKMGDCVIEEVVATRCLGVQIDDALKWDHHVLELTKSLLQVRCFQVVGSLCLNRTQGCRKTQEYLFHTNAVIPLKNSEQAHTTLVTTLDLRHSCINSCQLHVTSMLQFNKHDLCRHFTKPPSFSRDLHHPSVNTTGLRDNSLNTPGKNHLATRAVHVDVSPDYSTEKFLMVLRRFVSIRGYPSKLYSDNGAQLVAANKELKKVVKDLDSKSLQQFGVTQGLKWIFSSADAPWQNGISEALIKSVKRAITLAIGESVMTFSELQTVCFEAANLINERPIGRHTTSQDFKCFVVNNKCIAATNGFKLCSLISVNTHMRSKSIVKIQQS